MIWLWTWSGVCFGFRSGNDLWTHEGRHVGRFVDVEVYGVDGRYLGESMGQKRLITRIAKKVIMANGFAPLPRRLRSVPRSSLWANAMYGGFEDFPAPEKLT